GPDTSPLPVRLDEDLLRQLDCSEDPSVDSPGIHADLVFFDKRPGKGSMSEYHLLVQAGGRENEIIAYPDKVSAIRPKHRHSRLYARVDIDVVRVLVIPPQTGIEVPMTLTERMRHLGVGDERLGPEIGFHGLPTAVGEIQRLVRSEFEKFQKHIFVIPSKEN